MSGGASNGGARSSGPPRGGADASGHWSGVLPSHRPVAAGSREVPLTGGNTSTGVVRVGATVRKPAGPWTPAVHALLEHLRAAGLDSAPRSLGVDEQGRHVLEHVPGEVHAGPADPARFGRLLRDLHDACATFEKPPDASWSVVIAPDA